MILGPKVSILSRFWAFPLQNFQLTTLRTVPEVARNCSEIAQVPPVFIGQKIELRYDEGLKEVYVFAEGKKIACAKPVHLADNARVKREKPALSFTELKGLLKGGDS